ncbi:class I SAM-dependent methyltransferase [Rhodopirellula sallentina]|uniref:SAM dependent methyltransferase n=1 Tax=Rhodopirellula sallentina SM41 TaxID=1263870 RepID=M5U0I9_9BACT|nr:class I SAM-dependent methyltransferase [Rhodopirellula sallentina]EMI54764.1 SAM dependent methyltransferase [Rhodopirellula sallentina SM41]
MSRRYQLLDFGNGRKLESLAGRVVDRPCPAADNIPPHNRSLWRNPDSYFDLESKTWTHRTPWPEQLQVEIPKARHPSSPEPAPNSSTDNVLLRVPVQPTPFGHIGIFPEQIGNWRWLHRTAPDADSITRLKSGQALNLFAYTGASTMTIAGDGMKVAHVDAAKPNVEAAKRVAAANGLDEAPIRYLVDDAAAFVQREIRRGNRYHTIVLDPPAYGHGPKSKRAPRSSEKNRSSGKRPARQAKAWRIQRDLPLLLDNCFDLISGKSFRILVTGHSAEMDESDVRQWMRRKLANSRLGRMQPQLKTGRMTLTDLDGRKLDAGFYVRCWTEEPSA